MAFRCEDIIRRGLQRSMTDREIVEMDREARQLLRQVRGGYNASAQYADIHALANERWNNSRQRELKGRARAVELQLDAVRKGKQIMYDQFAGMEWEGISAMMVGSKYLREGARDSVDALRGSLTGKYVGGLLSDLEALGKADWDLFCKHKMDREIMDAMFALDADQPLGNGPAWRIARIIHKWQEIARAEENEAGAWIGRLQGYILRQTHDPYKLHKAGFEKWRDEMLDRLDWEKTADGEFNPDFDRDSAVDFLKGVYDSLVTGIHEKRGAFQDPLTKPEVVGSLAAKASNHRVLHFKSGGDFFEYNQQFGKGTMAEGVIAGLSKSAGDTALMRKFGPSPDAGLDALIRDLQFTYKDRLDFERINKLNSFRKRLNNQMKELDGTLNIEGNPTVAEWSRNIRAIESMSKLGQAFISGFSDVPLMAQEMAYQGRPFFRSLWDGLKLASQFRGTVDERRILSQCGVFLDSMAGDLSARFTGTDASGKLQWMMNKFFHLNFLSIWTDSWKRAATLMMSHDLAQMKGFTWEQLPAQRRRALSLYNIDGQLWDMLRKGRIGEANGKEFLTPEAANAIPAGELEAYLSGKDVMLNAERVKLFRKEVGDRLRSYFRDRVQYAVLEPDARTASIIHQGESSGTVAGEALRFCMQFKSFPAVFLQRTLGREIYGRGADTLLAGLRQALPGAGERSGLACMIAATTAFGFLSMCIKQLLAGKIPRDPTESMESFSKVFVASLVQGGGMGIYGDFLFGEKSRVGDDFLSSLAGPTMGSASSLVSLYKSIRDGQDVRATAFRTVYSHLPGQNLFWVSPIMNYLLLHSVYESLSPGYMKRFRKRVKEETNQDFIWEPNVWDWARK